MPRWRRRSDVGTLHNARYVLFDNGTRLLVSTTFDGDWDVYIDDFAASNVLDAWDTFLIHCEGYPDEGKASLTVDEIKEFLTANQVTAADFYLDYPGVTTKEIKEALRVQAAVPGGAGQPRGRRGAPAPGPQAAARGGGRLSPTRSTYMRRTSEQNRRQTRVGALR